MEEFVAYIVKNLVADPEAVEITSIEDKDNDSIKLEIRVAPQDIGKIIGRRGNTIHALRTILRRVCSRLRKKVQIDLIQPENGEKTMHENNYDESEVDFLDQQEDHNSQCELSSSCSSNEEINLEEALSELEEEQSEVQCSCTCSHNH
ncbi:KH domain-containing protein [Chlamydia sp. 17-3921]|uniref:KH domain-containing protein n=1 Tax=Chlamydia sp. 17-3921 TaxID=2675798 RepID=UPI00191A24A5|nr:KH domain-containing protein [Chlamydia sp. 17-3921]